MTSLRFALPGMLALFLGFAGAASALEPPKDPYMSSKGGWAQSDDDMWGFHRIGFTSGADSAWKLLPATLPPVTVAVIDTGLDWNHLDISWDNIWKNPKEIPENNVDDDRNGYVDDVIGWNFFENNNKPWDHDGHGTFVTGLIAADWNNNAGIAGVNPYARIMVLKGMNAFGHSRASYVAEAIAYAADNGAKIISISIGGKGVTEIETKAVQYAVSKGALIIVAAGNDGVELKEMSLASMDEVITVGSSDKKDERAAFSNWGQAVDVVAPGIDILSLRGRFTDTLLDIPGAQYTGSTAYVGADKRYYVAGGTSFSAPIVAGLASLVLAKDPSLKAADIRRIIVNSARDIGAPGVDQFSGYGIIDARAALSSGGNFFINAAITGVNVAQDAQGGTLVNVQGTADADDLAQAYVEIGAGENPTAFKTVGSTLTSAVKAGTLASIPAAELQSSTVWILKLVVKHKNGQNREARFRLQLG